MMTDYMCARIQHLKTQIFELEKQLEESERGRKANESSMFSYMHQRDYLEKQHDEFSTKLHASNSVIAALNIRVEELSKELAALRPPEPKFKVGQITVRVEGGKAVRIKDIIGAKTPNVGYVTDFGFFQESALRYLFAQEKGESA